MTEGGMCVVSHILRPARRNCVMLGYSAGYDIWSGVQYYMYGIYIALSGTGCGSCPWISQPQDRPPGEDLFHVRLTKKERKKKSSIMHAQGAQPADQGQM